MNEVPKNPLIQLATADTANALRCYLRAVDMAASSSDLADGVTDEKAAFGLHLAMQVAIEAADHLCGEMSGNPVTRLRTDRHG
jgi:hypothetical protein